MTLGDRADIFLFWLVLFISSVGAFLSIVAWAHGLVSFWKFQEHVIVLWALHLGHRKARLDEN